MVFSMLFHLVKDFVGEMADLYSYCNDPSTAVSAFLPSFFHLEISAGQKSNLFSRIEEDISDKKHFPRNTWFDNDCKELFFV